MEIDKPILRPPFPPCSPHMTAKLPLHPAFPNSPALQNRSFKKRQPMHYENR